MANYYIMKRKGIFTPNSHTPNQCKQQGHGFYEYICQIVFHPDTPLDQNNFLIDHSEVDTTIQNCVLVGSCETMHQNILRALMNTFQKKNIEALVIKVQIIPQYPSGMAELSLLHCVEFKFTTLVD